MKALRTAAKRGPNRFVTVVFWTTIAFLYLPLFYLVFQALLVDPKNWSSGLTLKWVLAVFDSPSLWRPLATSLEIALASATLATVLGTFGAVGLTGLSVAIPAPIQLLIVLPVLLPEVITGLSLLLFFLLLRVNLGFTTVVLAHASFSASFVYFIVAEQLKKLDPQLSEAARDLGARPSQVFWKVTLPNVLPGIAGSWLLAFTLSFDDFLISFFTSGAELTTLPLRIYSLLKVGWSNELNGLSLIMLTISVLLVCLLMTKEEGQKWVARS